MPILCGTRLSQGSGAEPDELPVGLQEAIAVSGQGILGQHPSGWRKRAQR